MSSINQVLKMDDAVDELSDEQLKDVWTRGTFMHQIIRANGPEFMRTDRCDSVEQVLSEMSNTGIKRAAIEGLGREHSVTMSLGWEDGPGNIETLFDRLTSDDVEMSQIRSNVKTALGSCGMPRVNVMRSRVQIHSEE